MPAPSKVHPAIAKIAPRIVIIPPRLSIDVGITMDVPAIYRLPEGRAIETLRSWPRAFSASPLTFGENLEIRHEAGDFSACIQPPIRQKSAVAKARRATHQVR